MSDSWITTFTGKQFHHFDASRDDIDIDDIAHSLSLLCRYNGHCRVMYSVAEHCVRLCDIVPYEMKSRALMHDAAEAYIGDVPSLLKAQFPLFSEMEDRILEIILDKYNIKGPCDLAALKRYENMLLAAEVRDLMPNSLGWFLPEEEHRAIIVPWVSNVAAIQFAQKFYIYVQR